MWENIPHSGRCSMQRVGGGHLYTEQPRAARQHWRFLALSQGVPRPDTARQTVVSWLLWLLQYAVEGHLSVSSAEKIDAAARGSSTVVWGARFSEQGINILCTTWLYISEPHLVSFSNLTNNLPRILFPGRLIHEKYFPWLYMFKARHSHSTQPLICHHFYTGHATGVMLTPHKLVKQFI